MKRLLALAVCAVMMAAFIPQAGVASVSEEIAMRRKILNAARKTMRR